MLRSRRAKTLFVRTFKALAMAGIVVFCLNGVALAQAANPEVVVMPQELVRLSWGAVLAGSVIALIIQLALNLLGISLGAMSINPEYGEDSASPKGLATGAAVWVGISSLISLFVGGWIAARFAGIPEDLDGALHGLMVWGLVTLISLFLLTTSVGRILTGVSTLVGHALTLAGHTVEGAAAVAGGAARGATQAVGSVAGGAVNAVGQTAGNMARSAGNAVQDAARSAGNAAQDAARQAGQQTGTPNPSADAVNRRIQDELRNLMTQAGISPSGVEQAARESADDVRNAAKAVAQNPDNAEQIINQALSRVLGRGQELVSQADRDALLDVMTQRLNVNRDQAQETLSRWENALNQARGQGEQTAQRVQGDVRGRADDVRRDVEDRADDVRREVEARVEEVRQEAEWRIMQVRMEAERTARKAADDAIDAIAGVAGAVFVAILVGAVAAGIGGALGAPEELPVAEIPADELSMAPAPAHAVMFVVSGE